MVRVPRHENLRDYRTKILIALISVVGRSKHDFLWGIEVHRAFCVVEVDLF